jgi:predicted glycosyltransferase
MLHPGKLSAETLAEAIMELPDQPLPASHRIPGLLRGLKYINATVARWRNAAPEVSRVVV